MTASSFDEQRPGDPNHSPTSRVASGAVLIASIVAMLAGCVLLLGGLVLHIGEKADRLFIFPFAGRLTMLLGIIALASGAAFAGRRAAMTLCVLMVIGGIVLYAIGLGFVEQLGTRLYQAGGLLTALVGLIALYATYGMDRATEHNGPSQAHKSEKS